MLKILGAVLLLAVLAGAVFLWNVHRQVSSVAPPLPALDSLNALRDPNGPISAQVLKVSDQTLPGREISHNAVLVTWPDERAFLIDAAMDATEAAEFGELMNLMSSGDAPAAFYGTVAEQLGNTLEQVAGVGFTHLHIDHTQGLVALCEAAGRRILGVQTAHQNTLHNFNTSEGARIVESSCLDVQTLPGDRITRVPGFPGLAAMSLGGHTPGSTLWVIALPEVTLLLAGDIVNSQNAVSHDIDKPWLYSAVLVPEDTERTAEIRAWLRAAQADAGFSVVVSHDAGSYDARWFARP